MPEDFTPVGKVKVTEKNGKETEYLVLLNQQRLNALINALATHDITRADLCGGLLVVGCEQKEKTK